METNKILIIPDVHARKFWKEVVSNNIDKVDKVIFLGDYLDPYDYEYEENPDALYEDSIDCLKDIINLKKELGNKCILLLGNHIDHYLWWTFPESSRYNRHDGSTYSKLLRDNIDLFNVTWVEKNIIFSHAGITNEWAQKVWEKLEYPEDELPDIKEIAELFRDTPVSKLSSLDISLLGEIGRIRGGVYPTGSCEWSDVREQFDSDMNPIKYTPYFQVFGHTQLKKQLITDSWACLDCRQGFVIDKYTHEISECPVSQ